MTIRRTPPPPWLFGVAAMPYGAFNGVVAVALPYLLRRQGLTVERIAAIAALVQAPAIWYVLWAPIVDIKFRRRTWIVALSVVSGAATAWALRLTMTGAVASATTLFVIASIFNQPTSSALGGLVAAVTPSAGRGRAAGWSQAGTLCAGVVAAGLGLWLSDRASGSIAGIIVGSLIVLPSFAALAVEEPLTPRPNRKAHIAHVWRDLTSALKRRPVWLGIVFFLSPAGAGALMNLFSGVAPDYHASSTVVIVVATLGGILTAVGALVGGRFLDRIDRWRAYPVAAFLTSAVIAAVLFAPLQPITYLVGATLYALVTGFGYAAFMALALDLIGADTVAGGTLFTLFTAAVNVPVVYMLRLDGAGHAHFGVRGMLAVDGIANAAFALVLLLLLGTFRPRPSADGSVFPQLE